LRLRAEQVQLDADLAMTIDIIPIRDDLIDSFHAALDQVCRERMYFVFLQAPPIEETRAFVRGNMAKGAPQLVAMNANRVVGWCDVSPSRGRPCAIAAWWALACCPTTGDVVWARN